MALDDEALKSTLAAIEDNRRERHNDGEDRLSDYQWDLRIAGQMEAASNEAERQRVADELHGTGKNYDLITASLLEVIDTAVARILSIKTKGT